MSEQTGWLGPYNELAADILWEFDAEPNKHEIMTNALMQVAEFNKNIIQVEVDKLRKFLETLPCPECYDREHSQYDCKPQKEDFSCCYQSCNVCGDKRNALAAYDNVNKEEKKDAR